MKLIFKKILKYYLKIITKLVLLIHRPIIIGIAGSTNKTFTKNAIVENLKKENIDVRANPKSFNTEIGMPLAILNLKSGYNSYKNWIPAIIKAPKCIFQKKFPKVLVLELGISDPGDMKYLISIAKPKIAIITEITQRYLEGFGDMDKLSGEYEYLIKNMPKDGLVLLNNDNSKVKLLSKFTKCNVQLFGVGEGANWQAIQKLEDDTGQILILKNSESEKEIKINKHGQHHIYSSLISLIVNKHVQENLGEKIQQKQGI